MSLEKRTIAIPLGGGVDEATSDVLFEAPLLREAVNARIPKVGSIGKRHGEDALASTLPSTSTYGEHSTIAEHDGRAVVLTQLGAYMHDPVKDAWVSSGAVSPRPGRTLVDSLVRQNNSSVGPDVALVTVNDKTIACVVWSDREKLESYYLWAEVPTDGSKLRVLSGPTMFSGTQKMVHSLRVATIGTTVCVIGADAGSTIAPSDVWCSKAEASSTYTFSSPTSVNPGWCSGAHPVALLSDNSSTLWAVLDENPGGAGYSVRKLSTSFVETANQTGIARRALDACRNGSTIAIICAGGAVDSVADSLAAPPTSNAIVTVNATNGPLYNSSTQRGTIAAAGSGYFAAWERQGTTTDNVRNAALVIAAISSSFAATASGTVGTVRLAGRAAYADGVPLLPVLDVGPMGTTAADPAQSAIWRCAYLARPATDSAGAYSLAVASTFGSDLAAYQNTTRMWTEAATPISRATACVPSLVYDTASAQWLMPHLVIDDATTTYGEGPHYGVDLVRHGTAARERAVSAQELRLFGGGHGVSYVDGPVHAEVTPPPVTTIDLVGGTAADLDASVYENPGHDYSTTPVYLAVAVRWRDEKGNLHRGAPIFVSDSVDVKPGTGVDVQRISIPRPFPATIRGEKGGQSYELEVYASNAADGPFYFFDVVTPRAHPTHTGVDYFVIDLYGATAGSIVNVPLGGDYVARVDSSLVVPPPPGSPAGYQGSAIPRWTDSGELVHTPAPPAIDVCSTQSRVWLLSAEAGRTIVRPSKLLTPGYAPEFCADLDVVVPSEGGECRAIAALNDKVVVFKERLVYVIFGDPGDNTGGGASLQTPRLVQSDVGCLETQSVVEGPFGVVFRSAAGGFHLLTPDTTVARLPQLEDSLGDATVLAGTLVADRKEVRWAILDGDERRTLVWDYEQNAWMTHEHALGTVHASTVGGFYARVAEGGNVYVERDTWSTTLDAHALRVTSAWIKPSSLNGLGRVWRSLYEVRWRSGKVVIRLGFDHDETFDARDERVWSEADLAALQTQVGSGEPLSLVVQHRIQKCRAFRFQIEEERTGGQTPEPVGEGFTLLGVEIEVGIKRGNFGHRVPAAARK